MDGEECIVNEKLGGMEYEKDLNGYKRDMPICGDHLAGIWGCGVADYC